MEGVNESWEDQLERVRELAQNGPPDLTYVDKLALQAVLDRHDELSSEPKASSPGYMAIRSWAFDQGHRLIVASKLASFGDGSMTYLATVNADEKLVCYRLVLAKRDLKNGTYPRLRVVTVVAPDPDDCMCAQESEYDRLNIAVLGCPSHGDTAADDCPHAAGSMQLQDDGLKMRCNDCGATWGRG